MTRIALLVLLTVAPTAVPLAAQNPIGDDWHQVSTFASRGSLGAGDSGWLLQRIDAETAVSYATDTRAPGKHVFTGFQAIVQDADPATAETFDIGFFDEDPVAANMPLGTTPVAMVADVPGPVTPVALIQTTFATPVEIDRGQDVHYGVGLDLAPAFPADGLSLQVLAGNDVGLGTPWDVPGPAGTIAGSLGGTLDSAGVYTLNSERKWRVDLLAEQGGAMVTAVTNQPHFVSSALAPGATGLSAYAPDIAGANPGRADEFGFVFLDERLTPGTPVTFFLTILPDPNPIPADQILPNLALPTSGEVCGIGANSFGATTISADGVASFSTAETGGLPAVIRPFLVGLPLTFQALAFDPNTFVLSLSPCRTLRM